MWKASIAVNLIGLTAVLVLLAIEFKNTGGALRLGMTGAVSGMLIVSGPYLFLTTAAIASRGVKAGRVMALAASLLNALFGALLLLLNTPFRPVPPGMGYENMAPALMAVVQWPASIAFVILTAAGCGLHGALLARRVKSRGS